MTNDSDACLPAIVTDFVFDLSDSVITSHIAEEQKKLYYTTFRDISSKYFGTSPWPSPQSIASECNGDPLFLALYRELTQRHMLSINRPTLADRIEGWHVYRELFDELLMDAENNSNKDPPPFFIIPEWTFDILHEFVYQFQGFCQYRAALHSSAKKHGLNLQDPSASSATATATVPHHLLENLTIMSQQDEAWAVEMVLSYLNRLVAIGKNATAPAYQYLGLFASVALSRLECLLGDYRGCLSALSGIQDFASVTHEGATQPAQEVVQSMFHARLSCAYHAGVAFLMLRRYKDASRTLGEICLYMQRGFKTGQLRKLPNSEQFNKLYERMICLLAIVMHICPSTGLVEDSVLRTVREKHSSQLSKIDAGEEDYEGLFTSCCPKFISPSAKEDAYKTQVKRFLQEMSSQHSSRKVRSYLKLYTSIGVKKLAAFNDMEESEFLPLLLSYKLKMRQLEGHEDKLVSAMDIHYYLTNDMVHVDEAEKERRFENYFMAQIAQNGDIAKDVEAINTTV